MSDSVVIYHNPRCSKSRQTLELLRQQGVHPEVVEYLKTPPGEAQLRLILERLGLSARELMRRKETEYRQAGLERQELTEDELIAALLAHPRLLERPIVLANDRAAIGRPPENVLDIL